MVYEEFNPSIHVVPFDFERDVLNPVALLFSRMNSIDPAIIDRIHWDVGIDLYQRYKAQFNYLAENTKIPIFTSQYSEGYDFVDLHIRYKNFKWNTFQIYRKD